MGAVSGQPPPGMPIAAAAAEAALRLTPLAESRSRLFVGETHRIRLRIGSAGSQKRFRDFRSEIRDGVLPSRMIHRTEKRTIVFEQFATTVDPRFMCKTFD